HACRAMRRCELPSPCRRHHVMSRSRMLVLSIGAAASVVMGGTIAARQVPQQGRQGAAPALRPAVMGPSAGVSAGHPLTTAAGFRILLKGGNAFDAGVAAMLAGGVLEQDLYSLGGEGRGLWGSDT